MQVVDLFTLGKFLRRQFGQPVQKLSIDGGFTCLGDTLIAPHWSVAKSQMLDCIAAEFGRRGTKPGSLLGSARSSLSHGSPQL